MVFERAALTGTSVLSLENVSAPPLIMIHMEWAWHDSAAGCWNEGLGSRAPSCVWEGAAIQWLGGRTSSFSTTTTWWRPFRLLPLSLPLAYCRGLLLSMLLKLWLRRLRLEDPGLLETPLPAAGTLEGPGSLEVRKEKRAINAQANQILKS